MKTRITSMVSRTFKHFMSRNLAINKPGLLASFFLLFLLPTTVFAVPPTTQPRYLYVADPVGLQILAYKITPITGKLVALPCSPIPDISQPVTLTVDRDGAYLYVANALPLAAPGIATYTINLGTGCLAPGVPVLPMLPLSAAVEMGITAHDDFLYVSDSFNNVVWGYVNNPPGTLTPMIGTPFPAGAPVQGLAADTIGSYLYVANDLPAGPIQQSTYGGGGIPGPFFPFAATDPFQMAVDPVGQCLHVTDNPGNTLTTYSIAIGGAIAVSSVNVTGGAGANPWGVSVDTEDHLVYVANNVANTVAGFLVEPVACKLAPVAGSPFTVGLGALAPEGIAVDPTGRFVYAADSNGFISGYTINENTGKLVGIAPFPLPAGISPVAIAIQP